MENLQGITMPQQIVQSQTIVVPTTSINQTKKITTKYDILEMQKTNNADKEFQDRLNLIYQKVGISTMPRQNIQILAVLLINEVETVYDFFIKKSEAKFSKCVNGILGYFAFCGCNYDSKDEDYVAQIAQLVFDKYSLKGCADTAKELIKDTKSAFCTPKK